MSKLTPDYTSSFRRDVKTLRRKHRNMSPLREVMELVLDNTEQAKDELRRRYNAHVLKGSWVGSNECHVANAGDWLLVWSTGNGIAVFQRTGSHDDIFC
ncbi:MAG: type II toxin-antitoxin system YafQ family toxin [Actinomycetaceae bacterium]|nr:type II toxin-antitoxin system YafQ family toxin [Arcanobacterium sp.]MDD7686464.1 type II toxin-antitoxin system YafQ family toxin [Actinomycetaceae bacterium]